MRIAIRDLFQSAEVGIWLFDDTSKTCAKPINIVMEPLKDSWIMPEPTMRISSVQLISLINSGSTELEMSTLGKALMPNRDKQLDALKYHLEDMRSIVFRGKK